MFDFLKRLFAEPSQIVMGETNRDLVAGISIARSRHWPSVREKFLNDHPVCEVTGSRQNLEVHHIMPFHLVPALELAESNLITLTRDVHFLFGHLGDWRSYNPSCVRDVIEWRKKIKLRPRWDGK